jgi:hypothetical protein
MPHSQEKPLPNKIQSVKELGDQLGSELNLNKLSPNVRSFLVCIITLAYPIWQAGFEIGVYGELFYERKFVAWVLVTAAFFGFGFLPRQMLPFPRAYLLILLVPSVWMVARLVLIHTFSTDFLFPVLFALTLVSYLFCLPFSIYLLLQLVNPEMLRIRNPQALMGLIAICVAFFAIGFGMGSNHERFVSCSEFEISGNDLPPACKAEAD